MGTPIAKSFATDIVGIVPAHAESTYPSIRVWPGLGGSYPHTREALPGRSPGSLGSGDHPPHTRGALRWPRQATRPTRGHPRIRGEHAGPAPRPAKPPGIIPAYAGSTYSNYLNPLAETGSSPRMRGAPRSGGRATTRARDHSRTCGEHATWASSGSARGGSSPHMRGARHRGHLCRVRHGIIPAHAGSTSENSPVSMSQ